MSGCKRNFGETFSFKDLLLFSLFITFKAQKGKLMSIQINVVMSVSAHYATLTKARFNNFFLHYT